jgi:uncharacterized hydrophobic protein (TIGR00341 family)
LRRIEIVCNDNQGPSTEYVFNKYKVPFHSQEVFSGEQKLLRYTGIVPNSISSPITNELNEIIDTTKKDLYVTSQVVEAAVSEYLSDLEKELIKKDTTWKKKKLLEEYKSLTEPSVEFNKTLLFMIIIGAGVATVGLFANNATLVIGAMLISPLLGPMTAFSFNVAIGKTDKMVKALVSGLILLIAVIGSSALLTIIGLQFADLPLTDEILSRTEITPVYLAVAIALGLAGGIAMTTDLPEIIVGVAIAAALVPPAAVSGIGVALWDFGIFSSALTLTFANIIGLILGMMVVFFLEGISPRKYYEKEKAQKHMIVTITIFICFGILLGVLLLKP